ncbi:DNA-(apurinic or apyrimidinic site) lyase [Sporothrix epigloea]|uniref:DNA-(Apurinic or apyrimidinic site) lyase n=1 Tax=Sporothrix epigloea TaxID=1892477 RepID=A0ABP0D995_9PEZI
MTLPLRQSPRKTKVASAGAERKLLGTGADRQLASLTAQTTEAMGSTTARTRGRPKAATAPAPEPRSLTTKTTRASRTRKEEAPAEDEPSNVKDMDRAASKIKTAVNGIPAKPSAASLKRKAKNEPQEEEEVDEKPGFKAAAATKIRAKVKAEEDKPEVKVATKPAKKSKAAKKAKSDDEPLALRTDITQLHKAMYIGAHVSSAGGVQNSVPNAVHIGGNAFALFLKSQRKWQNPALADDVCKAFHAACAEHGFDAARHCLPHGSYLVNLAQPEKAKLDQAYTNFVDDLRRCDALGICLYNFHPGAAVAGSGTRESALARIAAALNRAHADTAPSRVVTVIENMAGQGTTVGDRFEDLATIIAQIDDKTRVGVCIDTCHAFAAGYDLRTPESFDNVIAEFDRIVGLQYLRAVHLNDSKAPLASHRDLHANIGTGYLGLRAFHSLVNNDAFAGLPMVLETPIDRVGSDGKEFEDRQVWADEIKLLESLIGMDPESQTFKTKEKALQAEGAKERERLQEQVNKKSAKDAKRK